MSAVYNSDDRDPSAHFNCREMANPFLVRKVTPKSSVPLQTWVNIWWRDGTTRCPKRRMRGGWVRSRTILPQFCGKVDPV